jgi:hypothetical protein
VPASADRTPGIDATYRCNWSHLATIDVNTNFGLGEICNGNFACLASVFRLAANQFAGLPPEQTGPAPRNEFRLCPAWDWSKIEMNESKAARRLLLTEFAILPFRRQLAQERGALKPFAGSCGWLCPRAPRRFMDCFCSLSLCLSLPLIIWLSSGWIGLLAHWQMLAGVACLLEKVKPNPQPASRTMLAGNDLSEGEFSCGMVKSQAG